MKESIFAKNLKFYRRKSGLTQSALAKATGIGQVRIVNYEKGSRFPSEETIYQLARGLGIEMKMLFSQSDFTISQSRHNNFSLKEGLDFLIKKSFDDAMHYIHSWKESHSKNLLQCYREILSPLLMETGNRWQEGSFTVLEEHLVSERLREIIALLSADERSKAPISEKEDRIWIGLCAPSERHDLGLFMLSQVLRNQGWQSFFLGPDVPVKDLLTLIEKYNPHVIHISITMPPFSTGLEAYLQVLDESSQVDCPIIITGNGAKDMSLNYNRVTYCPSILDDAYDLIMNLEKS